MKAKYSTGGYEISLYQEGSWHYVRTSYKGKTIRTAIFAAQRSAINEYWETVSEYMEGEADGRSYRPNLQRHWNHTH